MITGDAEALRAALAADPAAASRPDRRGTPPLVRAALYTMGDFVAVSSALPLSSRTRTCTSHPPNLYE